MPLNKAANQGNDNLLTPYITIASNVSTLGSSVTPPNRGATTAYPSKAVIGDQFYDSTTNELKVYTVNGWVSAGTAPNAPTNVVATSAAVPYGGLPGAVITWTPATTGVPASSYVVTSNVGGFTQTTTGNSVTIYGLSAGTSYTFTVTAKNSFGSVSTTSAPITPITTPQSPTIGTASFLGSVGSISVAFTPGNTGGAATTYTATSIPGGISTTGASSPLVVSGLSSSQSYTFTVAATNSAGQSGASSQSNSVVPAFPTVTGGTLTSDATYYYNVFTAGNSTLTVSIGALTADILLIGGGGSGGGGYQGGGGGAGGVLYTPSVSLYGPYSTSVGAGGAGGTVYSNPGLNTSFGAYIAAGGGQGAGEYITPAYGNYPAGTGGSGGGGSHAGGTTPGNGTAGQGNAGGYGWSSAGYYIGGGGGGAGTVGTNAVQGAAGNGGNGTSAYASWLTAITSVMSGVSGWATAVAGGYIAGGGGGSYRTSSTNNGTGGLGGGGSAVNNSSGANGNPGITNTGGGGGAGQGGGGNLAGAGGSGLIIVRYTRASVGG